MTTDMKIILVPKNNQINIYLSLYANTKILDETDSIEIDVEGLDVPEDNHSLLKTFLEQLFHWAPYLNSIEIWTSVDGSETDNTLEVLHCFQKLVTCLKDLLLELKYDFDEPSIPEIAYYLPMLTSLTISIIYHIYAVLEIVSADLIHIKRLIYLQLDTPKYDNVCCNGIILKKSSMKNHIYFWLKEHTILGSSITERSFDADCSLRVRL